MMDGPIFIVSTGRSGSTAISLAISLIDGCECFHEPEPALIREASLYRYGEIEKRDLKKIIKESRPKSKNEKIYCESNQKLSLIIPVLAEIFPGARFLWLIRNGLDFVASAEQKRWYARESEDGVPYEQCSSIVQDWIDGRIEGDRCEEVSPARWNGMSHFERCCWYWNYVNTVIQGDLKKHASGNCARLRLEDINTDLSRVLSEIGLRHLVAPAPARHNTAVNQPYHWTDWTEKERKIFEDWCGETMDSIYPSWRRNDGTWVGVNYSSESGILGFLRGRYRLVKWVNSLLAPNLTHK
jgi:hypothetical protein